MFPWFVCMLGVCDSELGYPGCIPDASSIDETDGDLSSETRSGSEASDCETPLVGELWPDTDDEAEWYHHADKAYAACSESQAFTIQQILSMLQPAVAPSSREATPTGRTSSPKPKVKFAQSSQSPRAQRPAERGAPPKRHGAKRAKREMMPAVDLRPRTPALPAGRVR